MPGPKQHIADLAEICRMKGIQHVVISPGSRSAPLIKVFHEVFGKGCISIPDERSAAFFALGMALYSRIPVVLICTSGTAVLNYAPALAEAYHQHVPLIALTADRPREWIDQQDNQTLRQPGIYANFIKGSFSLPQEVGTEDDLWYVHRVFQEAIGLSVMPSPGPVHVNVPLTEPLYGELPAATPDIRNMRYDLPGLKAVLPETLAGEWLQSRRIMIIHGQDVPGSGVSRILTTLTADPRIIVMAENISNVPGDKIISNSNLVLSNLRKEGPPEPDLIVHSGGQVVSKSLTGYLRRLGRVACWRIGKEDTLVDTFRLLTRYIPMEADVVYRALAELGIPETPSAYRDDWIRAAGKVSNTAGERIRKMPYSDTRIFSYLMQNIPEGTVVVAGNSSVIRYTQLFQADGRLQYYANRGVSGIDGVISTAAGIARASGKLTLVICGDLGFLYDSNGLWNRDLPSNLRILVVNNGGGGIFHILKGPSDLPGFKEFIEANHPAHLGKLADAYGLDYALAENETHLEKNWQSFLHGKGKAAILEVKSDPVISASAFRQLMMALP